MGFTVFSWVRFFGGLWCLFTNKNIHMINYKYFIYLFCNKKKKRLIHKSAKRETVMEIWYELRTQKKPRYVKTNSGKQRTPQNYELVLIYPNNRWATTKTYIKDELGRNLEAKITENSKQRIKEIIPYWEEEYIYDFETKKRIRYHEFLEIFLPVNEISQIFKLNNKIVLQIEDKFRMFGNKNLSDADRLFDLIKEDLINKKKGNFIFVRDITTHQRKLLYELLEAKGYKRTELFRHYSY